MEQVLSLKPDWVGKRAFVIGGGPSLIGFDWELLRGENCIAVNRACETVPWADVLFSMDTRFYSWFVEQAKAFEGYLVHHRGSAARVPEVLHDRIIEVSVAGEQVITDDLKQGLGSGANSGYGAMNLALLLGANPVYLLGFDLNPTKEQKQQWWHDGYPVNNVRPWIQFRHNFEFAAKHLIPEGRVLNASVTSSIKGFPLVVSWPRRAGTMAPAPVGDFVVVSYFTNAYYREKAERMAASAERLGIQVWMDDRPDLGNWVRNCGQKPSVLLTAMKQFPDQDILWVDADAIIRRFPVGLEDFIGDVGYHSRGGQAQTGTVFLRNTPGVRFMVEQWITEQGKFRNKWDQHTFQTVLRRRNDLKVVQLPREYCFIYDTDRIATRNDLVSMDPIIEHFQASRKVKAKERAHG